MPDADAPPTDAPAPPAGSPAEPAGATSHRETLRRLGPVGALAGVAAILPALGGFVLLGTLGQVGPWLASHGPAGVALYILGFALLAGFAVLPTYAQAVLGGWAFGLAAGVPAALLGFTAAAVLGYAVARRVSGRRVTDLIDEQPKWHAIYHALLGGGPVRTLLIVTLLRLPPNSPFAMTNLALAACRVRPVTYTLGTLLGMTPRTAALVYIGAGLSELDFGQARQRWLFIAGLVCTLAVLAVLGAIANRALRQLTVATPPLSPDTDPTDTLRG